MSQPASGDRPLRRDAERNRQRLIEAARQLFAERGLDVSLDDIARHAGLGIGTGYRRFPDKELLVDAVFEQRGDQIVAIADRALTQDNSWLALVSFLQDMNTFIAADRGLRDILFTTPSGADSARLTRRRLAPALNSLIARAKADGYLRHDVERSDLLMVDVMVDAARSYTSAVAPEHWRRCLALVLDGLRAHRNTSALPEPALEDSQVIDAMRIAGSKH